MEIKSTSAYNPSKKIVVVLSLFIALALVPVVTLFAVCEYVTNILPFCTEERHPFLAAAAVIALIAALVVITARIVSLAKKIR
jgi:hypothetical protein